jgi:hypothetical protein
MADIGTLTWGLATDGRLTRAERLRLVSPILRTTAQYAIGRMRMALGLRPARQGSVDLDALRWPDSRLVRVAEECCRESLTAPVVNHSFRTFVFGLALAGLDRIRADPEAFLVTSLLHDIALETPTPGRCFAVVGGERALDLARRAGADDATGHLVAEAVCMHVTPGIDARRYPAAALTAAGALVDLLGLRLWDLDRGFVDRVVIAYPRLGVAHHVGGCWRRETKAVPAGRAALADRLAAFSLFMRLAPFPD